MKAGLALAITAGATVGYVGLTNEIAALNRRQVIALHQQLKQQKEALDNAQSQAVAELKSAKEAAATARRTVQEGVRARYDASSPRVAIQLLPTVTYNLTGPDGRQVIPGIAGSPSFIENEDASSYKLKLTAVMLFNNYGPTAALVGSSKATFGTLSTPGSDPTSDKWLLAPSSPDPNRVRYVYLNIVSDMPLDAAVHVLRGPSGFGVECSFEISDLLNQVTDTHRLQFVFVGPTIDGSRIQLPNGPIQIQAENGGVGSVTREYHEG